MNRWIAKASASLCAFALLLLASSGCTQKEKTPTAETPANAVDDRQEVMKPVVPDDENSAAQDASENRNDRDAVKTGAEAPSDSEPNT